MKLGLGLRLGNNLLISQAPSIVYDGNTVGWYVADDLNTITKDGSDFVSRWNDRLGSGHDLIQAVGTNQPKWFSVDGILFDGIDNFMKTAAFTFNQPEMIYIVVNQVTWTSLDKIIDGDAKDVMLIQQFTSPKGLYLFAGTALGDNQNLDINTFGIIRCLFNGASSKFTINNTTPSTGDVGVNNAGGFTLGGPADGSTNISNIQVKEIILRKVADGATDEAAIYNYLFKKYGI